jgi:hypothetical protein
MMHPLKIAIIGTGISGLSAAWLLHQNHDITVYEQDERLGGHANTVTTPDGTAVDTGFIVYNEATYPNLTALFDRLGVPTQASNMSFAISLNDGNLEYAGTNLGSLFAQKRNLLRPRFWAMLRDIKRFYTEARRDQTTMGAISLGDYLRVNHYSDAFRDDHLLPMAAAIWSAPTEILLGYPAANFVQFCDNHGLLQIKNRPIWRTVTGGSRAYIQRISAGFQDRVRLNCGVVSVARTSQGVIVRDTTGAANLYDHVILACHADTSLKLIDTPTPAERALLSPFAYSHNLAVLHQDARFMPRRRTAWASWNYLGDHASTHTDTVLSVTYWMNRLQNLTTDKPLFVTLNPHRPPHDLLYTERYEHPVFTTQTRAAQQQLWSLQGYGGVWFAGAYFGAGFHEDGLQAGLAVAEQIGGRSRPWSVPNANGRICVTAPAVPA